MSVTKLLAAMLLLSVSIVRLPAQETNSTTGIVSLAKLSPPAYPPLAKQVEISGDVELELLIRADGSIESTNVISGHPVLKQAALDSAQHSQFECIGCDKAPQSFRLLYSFQLEPAMHCTHEASDSRVVQAGNHITLYDRRVGTCDLAFKAVEKKVRSINCLYLWHCHETDWHEEAVNPPQNISGRVAAYSGSLSCLNGNEYWSVLIQLEQPTDLKSPLILLNFSLPCDKSPEWISAEPVLKTFRLVRDKDGDAPLTGCVEESCKLDLCEQEEPCGQSSSLPIWKRPPSADHNPLPFGQQLPAYQSVDLPLLPIV
jgi:TonB family protein